MINNPPFPTLYCLIHPIEPITHFCGSENCHQRALCQICKDSHQSQKQLFSSQDLQTKKLFTDLEKLGQEEGAETPENVLEQIETMFSDIKRELDKTFDQVRTNVINTVQSKLSRTKSWKMIYSDLQEKYNAAFNESVTPRSRALEEFTKDYNGIAREVEKAKKEPRVVVKPVKYEFEKMCNGVKEALAKNQERLVNVEYLKAKTRSKSKLTLSNLKKEKIVTSGYQKGIKPTAITYVEDLEFLAVSGGQDITLLSAKTFRKVQKREDVHASKVISLVYSKKKRILFSCAWDRTIKLFSMNKQGFKGLAKVINLPQNASASGLFVMENKGTFVTYGQGNCVRVWGLNDQKLKAVISTKDYMDMGPNMAYDKKNGLLAVFFYRVGKVGIICLSSRQLVDILETGMKQSEIFSEALLFVEKKNFFMTSTEFGKLRIWDIKNKKLTFSKDVNVTGYCFGMLPFEDDDTVLMVNYSNFLQVFNINTQQVTDNIPLGLKNASSLVHMASLKKFVSADSLANKMCVMNY